ncbi:MAG: hypothetical protein HYV07_06945 [Deltaproteobacteria bacterium]|nr:hypothetical protein [Deltaproteobacteria bacterium]
MKVPVEFAGHAADWKLLHSDPIESWIGTRPWTSSGGIRGAVVRSRESYERLRESVATLVESSDRRASDVVVREIDLVGLAASEIEDALGAPPSAGRRARYEELSHRLRAMPVVLTVPPSRDLARWDVEAISEVTTRLAKATTAAALVVLVFSTQPLPTVETLADLTCALPSPDDLFSLLGRNDRRAWSGYIHHRLAWECAGDHERAVRWAEHVQNLAVGDDDGFESALNGLAREQLRSSTLGPEGAEEAVADPTKDGSAEAWWRGPRDRRRIVPWVARGLLLAGTGRLRHVLRSALLCETIAGLLLDVCFDLECRARALPDLDPRELPDSASNELARFEVDEGSARVFYPRGAPSLPVEPLDVASLGALAHALPRGQGRDFLFRLTRLRNALAHQHYVGWRAVEEASWLLRAANALRSSTRLSRLRR